MATYKVTSKCDRIKEIDAVNEQELNEQIVEDFGFKIKKQEASFPCSFVGMAQQDSRWANTNIGHTNYKVGMWGCLICAISSMSYFNCTKKQPDILAQELKYTDDGSLYWNSITEYKDLKMKFIWRGYGKDDKRIKNILYSETRIAVVEVNLGSIKHWLSIIGYNDKKGFKVYDSYYDDYIYLNERYRDYTGFAEIDCIK